MMPPTLPHPMTGMAMAPSETIASVMPRSEVTTPAMVPSVSARAEVPPPREPHVGSTGASAPWLVTHGLTLRGAQLSWAILNGNKRVENRHFRMQPGWYALHTGAKTSSHESQLPLLAAVDGMPSEASLPHSAIIGALKVTHALTLDQCKPTEPWAFGPVVNVISAVCKLSRPVPARGALSVWRLPQNVMEEVQTQLQAATPLVNDTSHLPSVEEAPKVFPSFRVSKKAKGEEGELQAAPPPIYY